jgi:parallel beta-helix repeat protein
VQYGFLIMIVAGLFIAPAACQAENYFVSMSGNDAWPGTADKPFASIAAAQSRAVPGSVVTVMEGTYQGPWHITSAGTQEAPITFTGHENARVVIEGADTAPLSNLVVISASNVIFEGFEVANAKGAGVTVWGTTNVVFRNNVVRGSHRTGLFVGFETRGVSRDNTVEDNMFYGNVLENKDRAMVSRWASGIEISASDGAVVQRNQSFENFGEGISVMSSQNVVVERNLFYDNYSVNIYLDNARGVKVSGNTAGTSSAPEFFKDGEPAYGVAIVDKEAPIPFASEGNAINGNQWVGIEGIFVAPQLKAKRDVLLPVSAPNLTQPGLIQLEDRP